MLNIENSNISNVNVNLNNVLINMADNNINNFNLGKLTAKDNISLKLDLSTDNNISDSITVGKGSTGTILITGLFGITKPDFNITYEFPVLKRTDGPNEDKTYNINLALDKSLKQDTIYNVNTYLNNDIPEYVVYTDSFMGTTGVKLNKTLDTIIFGVMAQQDTLYMINIFEDTTIARSYNFAKDNIIYQTVDIDVTGAGKFIINGFNSAENSVIDFTDLTGFNLKKETNLVINNTTIQNANTAIILDNENATATLNNAILSNNIIAIQNKKGTVNINNSNIKEGTENNSNKIANDDKVNITNSTIASEIVNNKDLFTKDISEDDKTGVNTISNLTNNGNANLTSSNDIIIKLSNTNNVITNYITEFTTVNNNGTTKDLLATITTNGETTFSGTTTNGEFGYILTNDNTTFNIVTNDGEIITNGETSFNDITNNGLLTTNDINTITLIRNNGTANLNGNDTVTELINSGIVTTTNNTTFEKVTNGGLNDTTSTITTNGTTEFTGNVENKQNGIINLYGKNTLTGTVNNRQNGTINTFDSNIEGLTNENIFNNIQNEGTINFNSSNDTITELVNSGSITTKNKTTFDTVTSTGKNESDKATISTDGETIFNGILNNNRYSDITLAGHTTFNDKVINAQYGTITTKASVNSNIENISTFGEVTNSGTINFNNANDTISKLTNIGTITTNGTTIFDNIDNKSTGNITTSGTTTLNTVVDEGTITLGGTSTLNGPISGKGNLIVTGNSTLNTIIEKDLNVTVDGAGTFNIADTGILNLNNGDEWSGIIKLEEDNSTLIYNDLHKNGRLTATKGNLYINSGELTLGLGSTIAIAVNTSIDTKSTVNVNGGTLNLGEGDLWNGTILVNSGTLNINNIDSNSTLKATNGNLNIIKGNVDIDKNSFIENDVKLNLNGNSTINLIGGKVNINANDTFEGNINATTGTINITNRNSKDSSAVKFKNISIDDNNISNVTTKLTNTEIDLRNDNTYNTFNLGNLTIEDNTTNSISSSLKLDGDIAKDNVDSIRVGNNSNGTLTITEFNIGDYEITRNETKEFTILYRTALDDGTYNNDFNLALSDAITSKNNVWRVETYKNLDDNTYTVEDTSFIGTTGLTLIEYGSHTNIKIGVLEEFDTLYSVNIYDNPNIERVYVITSAKTINENLDLGITGSGKFTLRGATTNAADSIIDMNNFSAFDLENKTILTINNLTIQNASTAILSNNEEAKTTLNNVIIANCTTAIENNAGSITMNNSTIESGNNNIVINNAKMYLKSSTIKSNIENNQTLETSGNSEINEVLNNGTISLGGVTDLRGNITGNGELTIKGISNLYADIDNNIIVRLNRNRELYINDNGQITFDNNDEWLGKITVTSESSTLNIDNIVSNGTLVGTKGNINLLNGTLNLAANSIIEAGVIFHDANKDTLISINGGTLSVNNGDVIDGQISLVSGIFNFADLTQNGQINASGGELNIISGTLTIAENSDINADTILTINDKSYLSLTGGNLTINENDTIDGIINVSSGNLNIINTTLTDKMINIDNNNLLSVNTSFNNATIDLTSEDIVTNNTNLGNVTIDSSVNPTYLKIDVDLNNKAYDTISVGNSTGTIILSELNGLEPENIVGAGTTELVIIKNLASSNLKLGMTEDLRQHYEKNYFVASYFDKQNNLYDLTDESFIGKTGIEINNDENGIIVGILEQTDTLYATNISDLTPRRLTFASAKTINETIDLGITGSGNFTFNGYTTNAEDSILDMNNHSAFILEKETELFINNMTIQNASIALQINNEQAEAQLNNVVLSNNNIAIENKVGTLILKNSTVELGNETNSNKIINSDIANIINSEIASDVENNGSLYTVDISNDDKTGINRFNNIINKGDTNLTSSNDIINNLTNDNTVQTNNTTEFEGTVTNNENATITTNGNTTFNIIENKGLMKLNDSNNAQNITNNGTINIFGTSKINELTNNSEFTSSGKLEVNTLENNGNIITKINTTITQLTNNASINTSGTTIISQLENNDTAEFYDNTTITTLVNNSNTLLQGINNVTTIKNNGLSNDNKASLNLWGTNLINSTTSNNQYGTINVYGDTKFKGDITNDGTINSEGNFTSDTILSNNVNATTDLLKGSNADETYTIILNKVDNAGRINIKADKNSISEVTNTGIISTANHTTFGTVTNTGTNNDNKAILTSTGNTTFNGNVINNNFGAISLDGTNTFKANIIGSNNTEYYIVGDTSIAGYVTIGNDSIMTLNGSSILDSSLEIGNNSTFTTINSTTINGAFSIGKNSNIEMNGTNIFNSNVTIGDGTSAIFTDNTTIAENTTIGNNANISVSGNTNFNGKLSNTQDAELTTNGDTNFKSIENNGTITLNDKNTINGNVTGNGTINIINDTFITDGSIIEDLIINLENTSKLTITNSNVILNANDNINGNITAISGNLSIIENSITYDNLTISDSDNTNVTLNITDTTVSTANNQIQNFNMGILNSNKNSIYKLDLHLISDSKGEADTITVASGAKGIITIHKLNGLTKDEITHNDTATIKILNRTDVANADNKYDINLELTAEIISQYIKVYSVASYYDDINDIYDVKDTDFIGTTGIALNETLDSLLVGILSKDNTLHAVNIAINTPRQFTVTTTNEYNVTTDLETTGSGVITVTGHNDNAIDSIINMNNYSGFVLSNASEFTLKDLTIKNAKSENGSVILVNSIRPNVTIQNVIFDKNISTNNGGVIYTQGNIQTINAIFQNNIANNFGGALYAEGNSIITTIDSNFINNSAKSGGAIYLSSNGITSTYISSLNGEFKNNTAQEFGGAIANNTVSNSATAYSTIDKLSGTFAENHIESNTNLSINGGAIYNTGIINSINAEFTNNYLEATQTNSIGLGGAIYNNGTIDTINSTFTNNYVKANTAMGGAIYNNGTIHTLSSSFINNYVEGSEVYGGAIYTTGSITLYADNQDYTISGNYINKLGTITNQGIYLDGNGLTLSINVENNGSYKIQDNIDGRNNYVLDLTSNSNGKIDLFGNIYNATTLLNGASISIKENTFADNTTTFNANTGFVELKDNKISHYIFNSITSTSDVKYSIDLSLNIDDTHSVIANADTITVGASSSGTITLYDIALNILSPEITAILKDSRTPINVVILNKLDNSSDIVIALDDNILNNPIIYSIDKTYNYNVNDTDFIGSIGFGVNEEQNGVNIGVIDIKDTLVALNQFDKNPDGERSFNFVSNTDVYTVTEDLGQTGAGTIYININDKTIDFNNYGGFEVTSTGKTILYVNDATLTNSSAALSINTDNTDTIVTLSNVTFTNNITALSNTKGTVNLDNVTIAAGHNTQINAVMNAGTMNFTSNNTINSSVLNTGIINLDGTNKFSSSITGNGNGIVVLNSGSVDLTSSVVSDNTFTMNDGTIKIGSATFAKSVFNANKGSLSVIDNEYKNYSFGSINSTEDFEFSIDTDFLNNLTDTIFAGNGSSGIIKLVDLNGFNIETLLEKRTLRILYRENPNDEIYLSVSQDFIDNNKKEITMDDYYIDGKYIVSDTDFIGTLTIGLNNTRDSLITNIAQAGSSLAVVNKFDNATRIFNINSDIYKETTNLGITGSGSMTLNGNGHIADFIKYSGFEVAKNNTELNINNTTIINAYTKGNGSLVNATAYKNNLITITDTSLNNNTSEGLGGAIYTTSDLIVNADTQDVLFTDNKSNYNPTNYTWTNNSIYLANNINPNVNLTLKATLGQTLSILDGIDFNKNGAIININDGTSEGTVNVAGTLGSTFAKQLGELNINGGTFSLVDGSFSNICTNILNITKNTNYKIDIDVLNSVSDMIYPRNKYAATGENKLVLSQDSFNMLSYFSQDDSDIQASVIRLIATNNPASAYLKFANTDDDSVVYTFDNRNYYFTLGIDGTVIISTKTPDNYLHPLVLAIKNPKANTYTMNSNNLLYNYGNETANPTQNAVQSTKLTINGNNYSIISREQLDGILLTGTEKIKVAKQQLIIKNATMIGYKSAIINKGGKVTLTNTNFHDNETDLNGSAIDNQLGTLTFNGSKRVHSQIYNNRANEYGGAIFNNGTTTINYVDFGGITDSTHGSYANIAAYGGAIANTGKATISNARFDENIADDLGGAIYNTSALTLNSTIFTGNMTNTGGAIYNNIDNIKTTLTTKNSTFTSNIARLNGGAIYTTSNYTDTNSTFTNNTAINGAAIYKDASSLDNTVLKLSKTKFYENTVTENGGAINIQAGTLNLTSSTVGGTDRGFNGNNANYGGGIYNNGTTNITSSNFARNNATIAGGAIYNNGTLNVKKSKIGLIDSYGLYYGNYAIFGGGIYNIGTTTISDSTSFTSNNAIYGGAIYNAYLQNNLVDQSLTINKGIVFKNNTSAAGGAIYNNGIVTITSANFTSNKATLDSKYDFTGNGGAIYNTNQNSSEDEDFNSQLTINKSTFTSNSATLCGGAIYNNSNNVIINNSTFNKNTSANGGAIYNNGSMELNSNTFTSNISSRNGGAIYNNKNIIINKSNFNSANTSMNGGAIYNAENAIATITSSTFTNNNANIAGGAIYNTGDIKITSSTFGNSKKKYKYANTSSSGGAIYNTGNADIISSSFIYNTSEMFAGAIYNTGNINIEKSTISYNKITGINGIGGAIVNLEGTMNIYGSTINSNNASIGGAIYNLGTMTITSITSGKTTTKTTISSNKGTTGGAIYSKGIIDINNVNFTSNSSTDAGGALLLSTSGNPDGSRTPFLSADIQNTTFSKNTSKSGGAIFVLGTPDYTNYVKITNSTFTSNSAKEYGGAIYADKNSNVTVIDSDFKNNTASINGGAIFVNGGATVSIIAQNKDVTFSGNKAGKKSNSIYLNTYEDETGVYNAILNLIANNNHTIYIKDNIAGNGTIYESGNVIISNRSTIDGITFKPYEGSSSSLIIMRESSLQNCSIELNGTNSLSIANGRIATMSLRSLSLTNGTSNVAIDMDLKGSRSDDVTAESVTGSGNLNVNKVNITTNSKKPVSITIPGKDSAIGSITANKAESAEATYKLKTFRDENGILRTVAYGQKAKNATIAAPVAAQIGGYLTQINSYDQAFANLDVDMLKTAEERKAEEMMNKYAASNVNAPMTYSEKDGINYNSKGLWNRAYATFENVPFHNGPRVNNVGYGNFFGGDMGKKELSNGWKRQFSAYIAYNGSTQDYTRQSIDQNGGTIGVMETWYKGNFFTSLTANVGANNAEANTDLGKERMVMLMAGIASKTGYNFEFKNGKFIVQPSVLLSYSFIQTLGHDNGIGHHVGSNPINAIQVAPGIKFIANLKNGWQPYIGVNMRWNIMDQASFNIPDVTLPTLSIRPYVEYGIGVQKRWGDRFTGYGQAMIRNGGRNGVMLSIGFRWAIGK